MVTNDFPPRVGGVQQYVWNLLRHLPADRLAVVAPNWPGWQEHDSGVPFPIHRWPTRFLWPTADLAARVRALVREHRAEVILFGHGYPLPLLAPGLAGAGVPSVVLTHGAEVWLARTPAVAGSMRWALRHAARVTAVSRWTARALRHVLPAGAPPILLPPAVEPDRFSGTDGEAVRERHALDGCPTVVCVSRLVPRKGQDALIGGMGMVRDAVPDAVVLLVGGGPDRPRLEWLAGRAPPGSVRFAGEVSDADLPAHYAAAHVFAMPCRSRWAGLEVEGFGIVFLEAAAAGKAVVAGRSGGADEAVQDRVTGLLVEGREPKAVAVALIRLLLDPAEMGRMGRAGRARVEAAFTWSRRAEELAGLLSGAAS